MKFHFSKVEIDEKYLYRLLNNSGEIRIRNIVLYDGKCSFIIDYSNGVRLRELLKKLNIEILSWEDQGIYTAIINFAAIKTLIGVSMIFILLMLINSLFIWNISVDGNYSYSERQIISFVHKNKITEGSTKVKIDCDKLEKEIRKKFDDISWVCAEIKGTNLIVHVKENYITDISVTEDKPYDIVANHDAVIESILVRSGKAMVKAGDSVKKGDILISGMVDVLDESGTKIFSKFYNSDGDIIGKTVYDYKDVEKINYTKKITKNKKTIYLPSILNYKWIKLKKKNNSDLIYSEKKLKMFGNYYLPISIQKYTTVNYINEKATYSKEQAKNKLENRLLYKLAIMEQKGYKIIEKNVRIDKNMDSYVLSGKITCLEPLGMVSYIDTNIEEEGTTVFHERN